MIGKKELDDFLRAGDCDFDLQAIDVRVLAEADRHSLRTVPKSSSDGSAGELSSVVVVMQFAQQYQISGVALATGRHQIGMMRFDNLTTHLLPFDVTASGRQLMWRPFAQAHLAMACIVVVLQLLNMLLLKIRCLSRTAIWAQRVRLSLGASRETPLVRLRWGGAWAYCAPDRA